MKNSCETANKKMARIRIWQAVEVPAEGNVAVLAGPDNGDARHLRALGVDPGRILCIDGGAKALASARKAVPGAMYQQGDFLSVLRESPGVGALFLDETRAATPEAARYLADCLALLPMGAPFAAAYSYGHAAPPGQRPDRKQPYEHWADEFCKSLIPLCLDRRFAIRWRVTIRYYGRATPMLAFVGQVVDVGQGSGLSRKTELDDTRASYEKQVRTRALSLDRTKGLDYAADYLCLPRTRIAAWKAVETASLTPKERQERERYARNREKKRAYREANREACLERERAYDAANREAKREKNQAYREANREALREKGRARYAANREVLVEYARARHEANREVILEKNRARYAANREANAEKARAYRAANREAISEKQRAYRAANRERLNEAQKAYLAKKAAA